MIFEKNLFQFPTSKQVWSGIWIQSSIFYVVGCWYQFFIEIMLQQCSYKGNLPLALFRFYLPLGETATFCSGKRCENVKNVHQRLLKTTYNIWSDKAFGSSELIQRLHTCHLQIFFDSMEFDWVGAFRTLPISFAGLNNFLVHVHSISLIRKKDMFLFKRIAV